MITRCKNL